jgi:signal transduction histidine kinase/CheY-like chemotaxis protein
MPPLKTQPRRDRRVLVLAPTGRDGQLAVEVLSAQGFSAHTCASAGDLCREAQQGAGLALVADEALATEACKAILAMLRAQPYWSDLPMIVLARRGEEVGTLHAVFESECNMTILERPVQIGTLVSAVNAALRARNRQYEVRDLVEQLQDADRRKDEFLAMLGHELRNPLGVIRTTLQLLRSSEPGPSAGRQVVRIEHQIAHLTRMVDDLLDLSRVSRGRIALQREPVELGAVAEAALEACRSLAESHRVEHVGAAEPLWVDGDPVRLEQVITNLLQNALKYTPPDKRVELSVARRDDHAVVTVRDEGIGIHPEALERIFDTFTQLSPSLARSRGGLGLGLSLVRYLVRLHGGHVEAHSAGPGTGSAFVVELPLLPTAGIPSGLPAAREAAPRLGADGGVRRVPLETRPPLVLVVEDLDDAREAIGELLSISGFEVDLACDGLTALELAAERAPRVALVDIGLPGLDGYEVARRLRQSLGAGVRLVAMTGYGQAEDRQRALQAGFDQHMVKPVDPVELTGMLRRLAQA